MRYSKEEILGILEQLENKKAKDLESDTLEFKEWITNPKELCKTLAEYAVCFANQKGGTTVLGVRDNVKGKENAVTGCSGYNIHEIKSSVYEATDPKILIDIEELNIEEIGGTLLLIHIPQGIGVYTTTDGTGKIRIGKTCKPLTGSMRQQRLVELGLLDVSEVAISKLSVEAFDKLEIERLRNIIRARNPKSPLLKLGEKELLKNIGLIKDNTPTVAGVLLVGKEETLEEHVPAHEVIYLHMKNDVSYDQRSDYKKGILHILEDIYKNIEIYNKITTIKLGLFHFEIEDFPKDTYREAILNALLHRNYSEGGAVFIKHYKDRIEVSNPGGFISGITPENIIRQDSRPRNRHLAEALRRIGLVEKAGMGIKGMFYTQLASGKETPAYSSDEHNVRVVIKDGSLDEPFVRFIKESEKKGNELGLEELLILSILKRQREVSLNEAIHILQLDALRAREILMKMTNRGYLEKSGVKKGQVFRLSGNLYKQIGESISYIRERGIDEVRYPELVLKFVKEYGSISNRQVRELLGVDRNRAFRILSKLEADRKIKKTGSGRGAMYVSA